MRKKRRASRKPLADERQRERERLEGLIEKRKAEIVKSLAKNGIKTAFLPGILNADATILEFQASRAAVSGSEKAVSENDQLRAQFLANRIAQRCPCSSLST